MKRLSAILLAVAALLALAAPASAHAIITASQPAANASVAAGQVSIVLTYNSRIDRKRSRVGIYAADGTVTPVAIANEGAENVIEGSAQLAKEGAYQIRWQVLSVDGHITRGLIPFKVAKQ